MTLDPFQSEEVPLWSLPVTLLVAENTCDLSSLSRFAAQSPCLNGNNIIKIIIVLSYY